jgi:hypothetical protein
MGLLHSVYQVIKDGFHVFFFFFVYFLFFPLEPVYMCCNYALNRKINFSCQNSSNTYISHEEKSRSTGRKGQIIQCIHRK